MRELMGIPRIRSTAECLRDKYDFELDFSYLKARLTMYLEPLKVVQVSSIGKTKIKRMTTISNNF